MAQHQQNPSQPQAHGQEQEQGPIFMIGGPGTVGPGGICRDSNGNMNGFLWTPRMPIRPLAELKDGTFLHFAVENGHVQLATAILNSPLTKVPQDTCIADKDGYTCLHLACLRNNLEVVQLLLERGGAKQNVNDLTRSGDSPIYLLSSLPEPNVEIARVLLQNGAEPSAGTTSTAMHRAILKRNQPLVELFLRNGFDLHRRDLGKCTPGHVAVISTVEILKLLLDAGAPIEAVQQDKLTPLHLAVSQKRMDSARLLIERGANIEARTSQEMTVLWMACHSGDFELLQFLIEKGAQVETSNHQADSALCVSCFRGHEKTTELLLKHNANVRHKNCQNNGPLHMAAGISKNLNIVKLLLRYSAPVNDIGMLGKTPLHLAYHARSQPIIQVLLEHGADTNIKDETGKTPKECEEDQGSVTAAEKDVGPTVKMTLDQFHPAFLSQIPKDMYDQLKKQEPLAVPPNIAPRLVNGTAKLVIQQNQCYLQ